ncbi:hypothetical protein HASA104033_11460 [Halobacterium salinarum]|uniref:Uncharacterized protein n=1 Tax=Halobacterium salinarum (strain ATCC 33171 / DSM 3754 / JCM 8978 / NBRC 102687 / NCIMB 764 / 91-R6) TaxID=2597657 RepID=A0A663A640_HALS9|nr:hypothetical protein APQ99_02356 [Halobacterium salinarum DSM 3754]
MYFRDSGYYIQLQTTAVSRLQTVNGELEDLCCGGISTLYGTMTTNLDSAYAIIFNLG